MKRQNVYKMMSLLLAMVLVATALLTGCNSKTEDPADHNHNASVEQNHDASAEQNPDAPVGHKHEKPVSLAVSHTKESDGTFTCTVTDCKGEVLFAKKGLSTKCISEAISDSVFSLSWLVNNNPGGYESVYFDRLNCFVSEVFAGEQATDGTRLIYTETKDKQVSVIIRDLFDKNGFRESGVLKDAYVDGDYTVLGAQVTANKTGKISYLVDDKGGHCLVEYNLYPDARPTKKTEK